MQIRFGVFCNLAEKEKKGRVKKKIEKLKDVGHLLVQKLKILISVHAQTKRS